MITKFSWENAYNWDTDKYDGPLCDGDGKLIKNGKSIGWYNIEVYFPHDEESKRLFELSYSEKYNYDENYDGCLFLVKDIYTPIIKLKKNKINISKLKKDLHKELNFRFGNYKNKKIIFELFDSKGETYEI